VIKADANSMLTFHQSIFDLVALAGARFMFFFPYVIYAKGWTWCCKRSRLSTRCAVLTFNLWATANIGVTIAKMLIFSGNAASFPEWRTAVKVSEFWGILIMTIVR
jgi:hypothetical protein